MPGGWAGMPAPDRPDPNGIRQKYQLPAPLPAPLPAQLPGIAAAAPDRCPRSAARRPRSLPCLRSHLTVPAAFIR